MNPENKDFHKAVKDYAYLINRNYPDKGAVKLVGDRYRLSGPERIMLYRGVNTQQQIADHSARLITKPDNSLIIDGYNVLFTLLNYRLGNPLFISTDNLCRDAGALYGKIDNEPVFFECLDSLVSWLVKLTLNKITVYMDSSVKHCDEHAERMKHLFRPGAILFEVSVVDSADHEILRHTTEIIATSDTGILDQTNNRIFDLPGNLISDLYNADLPKLGSFLMQG